MTVLPHGILPVLRVFYSRGLIGGASSLLRGRAINPLHFYVARKMIGGDSQPAPRMAFRVKLKGAKGLIRELERIRRQEVKAFNTAIKVEAFRLRNQLKSELRAGAPGGVHFAPLSWIAKGTRRGRGKPLSTFSRRLRYYVKKQDPFTVSVGWAGHGVSSSYKRLVRSHQEGFTKRVSERQESFLRRVGGGKGKRSLGRKFFFLKASTTTFRTPARPILDPFWAEHKEEAWRNIRSNWKKKKLGQRI